MDKIKAIPYERVEQKNEMERKMFSKLTARERRVVKESWLRLLDAIFESGIRAIRK
jgi:hypothetical protein